MPEAAHYLIQRPLPASELRALFDPLPPPGRYLGVIERLYADCGPGATDLDRIQEVALQSFLSEHVLAVVQSLDATLLTKPFSPTKLTARVVAMLGDTPPTGAP